MGPTVLIVDDHPGFRATARLLLETDGYAVVGEAGDGATALTAAAELRPAIVLLDVNLPDRDGFTIATELTRWEDAPEVVLTSSHDPSDFGPLVGRCGACGFVAKADLSGRALSALVE